jgi:hypothetical protein
MKKILLFGVAIMYLLVALSLSWGQALNATSDPFTFPALSDVKNGNLRDHQVFFKSSKIISKSNSVVFSWAISDQIRSNTVGNIVVFSLLGRAIKTFRVNEKTGSITWKPQTKAQSGVYIVRLIFGSYSQNLKIVLPQ